ncbi:hypothetical protein VSO92_13390 [Myroides pelagicus]|uniref:hypothetical protein n=1 Tax=Myroides pelagicus TaxID=270914 RepID=UPI002DB85250|nr:hypothetical protein [Myroides pelagicus]MEC4115093.1 hypothetical protein [Myroides pelagicus]
MNKTLILTIYFILPIFLFSCQEQKKETTENSNLISVEKNTDNKITIQGKITLKGSQKAPLGVTTMNVKNRWAFKKDITKFLKEPSPKKTIAYGENERVFVNKDGYYKITINKNDTLQLISTPYLYKYTKQITGLNKSQTLNIEIENLPLESLESFKKEYPLGYKIFYNYLNQVNPDSLITVSGTIFSSNTKIPLENIDVATSFLYNTRGSNTFHFTDKNGQFNIKAPKNSHILINGMKSNYTDFIAKKDTIIHLYL